MTGVELGDLLFYMDQKQIVTPGSHVHAVERYPEELREILCIQLLCKTKKNSLNHSKNFLTEGVRGGHRRSLDGERHLS